jgi:CO dehydrogenase maturation factor
MTVTIAVAGKGGTGKTTFAALTIKYLLETGRTPVLAIDGDPSANLNLALGMPLRETVGQIREGTAVQVAAGKFRAGVSKPDWFELKVNECLVEGEGVDLLAMGRPEGPGCYCAANSMLRQCIDRLGSDYPYVVIDNEAGMEHISRQTARNIDHLFIVTDPTLRGLVAAEHIVHLTAELGTRIGAKYMVVNSVTGELPEAFTARIAALGLPLLGTLPRDSLIQEYDLVGRPLVALDDTSLIYPAVRALLRKAIG